MHIGTGRVSETDRDTKKDGQKGKGGELLHYQVWDGACEDTPACSRVCPLQLMIPAVVPNG